MPIATQTLTHIQHSEVRLDGITQKQKAAIKHVHQTHKEAGFVLGDIPTLTNLP